jgi:hypothetical protein
VAEINHYISDNFNREALLMMAKSATPFFTLLVCILITGLTAPMVSAGTNKISVKASMTYSKKEVVPIGYAEGHILMLGVYEGCAGEGTYQGHFTAENEYIVEYKGTLIQQ